MPFSIPWKPIIKYVGIFLSKNCVFRCQGIKILQDKSYLLHQMGREETLDQLCFVFLSLSGHWCISACLQTCSFPLKQIYRCGEGKFVFSIGWSRLAFWWWLSWDFLETLSELLFNLESCTSSTHTQKSVLLRILKHTFFVIVFIHILVFIYILVFTLFFQRFMLGFS